ncbi:hypothetical protein P7L74_01515 (plasmid) [Tistrella mobilis]|uniref:hypothetical protein n=1 Tax=Tistrella mobilis TaxID=171437 RepID=UPI003558B20B
MPYRHVLGFAVLAGVIVAGLPARADLCSENVYVTQLNVGGRGGTDSNADIGFVVSDGKKWYLNTSYNANDAVGKVLYSQLLTAYTLKVPVNLYDNYGTRCDDISEITLMNF